MVILLKNTAGDLDDGDIKKDYRDVIKHLGGQVPSVNSLRLYSGQAGQAGHWTLSTMFDDPEFSYYVCLILVIRIEDSRSTGRFRFTGQ